MVYTLQFVTGIIHAQAPISYVLLANGFWGSSRKNASNFAGGGGVIGRLPAITFQFKLSVYVPIPSQCTSG